MPLEILTKHLFLHEGSVVIRMTYCPKYSFLFITENLYPLVFTLRQDIYVPISIVLDKSFFI